MRRHNKLVNVAVQSTARSKMPEKQIHRMMLGRLILSLFVFAWAGASAQPCLMALDTGSDAPMAGEHAAHGAHHASQTQQAAERDCDHCPPGGHRTGESCAGGLNAECGAVPDASADSRTSIQKLKDAPGSILPAGLPATSPIIAAIPRPPPPLPGQLRFRAGPSLSIRYCVYLK